MFGDGRKETVRQRCRLGYGLVEKRDAFVSVWIADTCMEDCDADFLPFDEGKERRMRRKEQCEKDV